MLAGATTIWERWDALRPDGSVPLESLGGGSGASMVSFNHYAYGAVAQWLHATVAGLRPDPDDPGYHHVLVEPRPGGGLTHASASLHTRYGQTSVAWHLDDQGGLHVDVELPPNTSATVTLPAATPSASAQGGIRSHEEPCAAELDALVGEWTMTMSGAWFLDGLDAGGPRTGARGSAWIGEAFVEMAGRARARESAWHLVFGRSGTRGRPTPPSTTTTGVSPGCSP